MQLASTLALASEDLNAHQSIIQSPFEVPNTKQFISSFQVGIFHEKKVYPIFLVSMNSFFKSLKGEFTDFLKFNTTLGHIYTLHFTIKTPSDWFCMAVMAQNVVLFCTLLSLHKEKTLTTNIK